MATCHVYESYYQPYVVLAINIFPLMVKSLPLSANRVTVVPSIWTGMCLFVVVVILFEVDIICLPLVLHHLLLICLTFPCLILVDILEQTKWFIPLHGKHSSLLAGHLPSLCALEQCILIAFLSRV